MKCRLTGIDGPMVEAHIIPRSFYRLESQNPKPLMILQSEVKHYPKRSPTGIYDSTILSLEGERLLSPLDDHACAVLLDGIGKRIPLDESKSPVGYILNDYDYRKTKLFFISLLWRASVASHPFFQNVDLGSVYEERARQHILSGDPGGPEDFAVVVVAFEDIIDSGFVVLDPIRTRFDGLNYYLFYLNHVLAYIKVDKRPSGSFSEAVMRPDKPLLIVNRGKIRESKEYSVMRSMALKNHDFLPEWWKEPK